MTIKNLSSLVEREMQTVLSQRSLPLYQILRYHLGWIDESGESVEQIDAQRDFGVACLASNLAAGGKVQTALPAAVSVEFTNAMLEIHNDVQGGNPQRDGRDAVWWKWGPAQAINAGDAMHALARLSLMQLQHQGLSTEMTHESLRLLDSATLELCEGRFQELEAQERLDLGVETYFNIASRKTASLYSISMQLGALTTSAPKKTIIALGKSGTNLGMALQISDDIQAIWGPTHTYSQSPEILNKTKVFPIVYALEKANINLKRRLGEVYFKRVLDLDDLQAIRKMLDEIDARTYSQNLANQYHEAAIMALNDENLSQEGADSLSQLIDSLLET